MTEIFSNFFYFFPVLILFSVYRNIQLSKNNKKSEKNFLIFLAGRLLTNRLPDDKIKFITWREYRVPGFYRVTAVPVRPGRKLSGVPSAWILQGYSASIPELNCIIWVYRVPGFYRITAQAGRRSQHGIRCTECLDFTGLQHLTDNGFCCSEVYRVPGFYRVTA